MTWVSLLTTKYALLMKCPRAIIKLGILYIFTVFVKHEYSVEFVKFVIVKSLCHVRMERPAVSKSKIAQTNVECLI